MQTVVMSFARGLYLGPELPFDHVHIPAQIVHKVTAQCEVLKLGEVWLDARKRYKHNVDNAAWRTLQRHCWQHWDTAMPHACS